MQGFMVCTDRQMLKGAIKYRTIWGESVARRGENRNVDWLLMGKSDEKGPRKTCE